MKCNGFVEEAVLNLIWRTDHCYHWTEMEYLNVVAKKVMAEVYLEVHMPENIKQSEH